MSKGKLSFDSIQKHAAVLVRVLKSLRATIPGINSDKLWDAIKNRWSEEDLAKAIEAFKKRGHVAAFRKLFDELPKADSENFFQADEEKWGTVYATARLTHASQKAILNRIQTRAIRTRMGRPHRGKRACLFVAVSDVRKTCAHLVMLSSETGSLKADTDGFIRHRADVWGTPKSFGRLYGVSYKRIQKAIQLDPSKFRVIQARVSSGNPRPFYAKPEIDEVCQALRKPLSLVDGFGADGFYRLEGKLWGEPKAFCRKYSLKSVKTFRVRVRRANCRTLLAKNGQNRARTLYEDAEVRAACRDLIDAQGDANKDGFVMIAGVRYGSKHALGLLLGIRESTVARYLTPMVRSIACKDRNARSRVFYSLKDVRTVCAPLLNSRGKASENNLLSIGGEKWGARYALSKQLGVDHTTVDALKKDCRSIKGKDRFGRPRILYSFSDMKRLCQPIIDRTRRNSDPVTDALLKKNALVLSRILRTLRAKRKDVVSDQLWSAIKKNWPSTELLRAIAQFKKNGNVAAFLKLVPS